MGWVAVATLAGLLMAACTDSAPATDNATAPTGSSRPGGADRATSDFGGTAIDVGDQFPSLADVGPRIEPSSTFPDGLETERDGQVISGAIVVGRLTIRHDDVLVRDTRIEGTVRYMIQIETKEDGTCPTGVMLEAIEIDGSGAEPNAITVYSPECGFEIAEAYIHDAGRSIRIANGAVIRDSYIHTTRTWEGAHRSAISSHGGTGVSIIGNTIVCEGTGCSAALTLYGDDAPIENYLVEGNLFATTGSYCIQGGMGQKSYPDGSNVQFVANQFSTVFHPQCGSSGPIASFEAGERGNEWTANTWFGTGDEVVLGDG